MSVTIGYLHWPRRGVGLTPAEKLGHLMADVPQAFVYDAIRTPRGKGKKNGSLHEVKPVDLVVGLLDEIKDRNPGLDPARVDDVVLGVVSPLGDQGGDIAKTAVLAAGYPETVAGVQLNRFCASGLEAVNQAAAGSAPASRT